MLSAEEVRQLQASIASVEAVASQTLRLATAAGQAITFVSVLHHNLDLVAAAADRVACRPGCAHCCSLRVEVTDPEALQMAERVRQLPQAEQAALVLRLQRQARHWRGAETQPAQRLPCALLVDQHCSIYAQRPSACRKAHSLSAAACETGAAVIPQSLDRVVRCEALIAGTRQAYQNNNLPAASHELAAAVQAALQDPRALENWYQGRPLALAGEPQQTP